MDDVIKVSGHRLGTAEIESALGSHPAVAEAAVVGYPHDVKGEGALCVHYFTFAICCRLPLAFILFKAKTEHNEIISTTSHSHNLFHSSFFPHLFLFFLFFVSLSPSRCYKGCMHM